MRNLIIKLIVLCTLLGSVSTIAYGQATDQNPHHNDQGTTYDITTVGGEDIELTFPSMSQDGITVGQTTVTSQYPFNGMTFTVPISSDQVIITNVTLYLDFPNGTDERTEAEYDANNAIWVARPWFQDGRNPPWRTFEFYWRIITSDDDVSVDTPINNTNYWDPTREWYRYETHDAVLYWFGLEDTEPEYVAETFTVVMDVVSPRLAEAFGIDLGYKPIFLMFPTLETTAEMNATGIPATGVNSRIGLTFADFGPLDDEWYADHADCIYVNTDHDSRAEIERVDHVIEFSFPLQYTYQYQYITHTSGLTEWWTAGQGLYFGFDADGPSRFSGISSHDRLLHLSQLQDIPTLQGPISARSTVADGCDGLSFDVGASFIDWLVENHGGLATHAQIITNLRAGDSLMESIENAVGLPVLDIENAWRISVGFDRITPEELDPSLLLTDAIGSRYVEGDIIDAPGPRPMSLQEAPGPNQISNSAACFPGSQIEILRVGSLDGVNYYEVTCDGFTGWVSEEMLP